jgi:hypothetical protein
MAGDETLTPRQVRQLMEDVQHALERAEWHWDDDERCAHYLDKVAEQVRILKLLWASDARMKRLSRRGTR